MDQFKNSLDGAELYSERRSGNTTRIIDNVIQQLFAGYRVIVNDYDENYGSKAMQVDQIIYLVKNRMDVEHRIPFIKDRLTADRIRSTFLHLEHESGEFVLTLRNYKSKLQQACSVS